MAIMINEIGFAFITALNAAITPCPALNHPKKKFENPVIRELITPTILNTANAVPMANKAATTASLFCKMKSMILVTI